MKRPEKKSPSPKEAAESGSEMRIIGGHHRGRKLRYSGDVRTRPMKDRIREAVFNLLRNDVAGTLAIDLFAGTGALGLEALSRGSLQALFIERHFPTAKIIQENARSLGIEAQCRVLPGSAFFWARKPDASLNMPWLVFCSPPYAFYQEQWENMRDLIQGLLAASPPGSIFVVEATDAFDHTLLPQSVDWETRIYPPAMICLGRKVK
jgi:16S rRNA (guanine(966)-N(2))-methyltransferase RsmD